MINIVIVVPSIISSGPIKVVYNIVANLDRCCYNPIIVSLSKHKSCKRSAVDLFIQLGVKIIEYDFSKLSLMLNSRRIAKRLSKLFPVDYIFHAHGYFPTVILSKMKNRRTITTVHNICGEDYIYNKGKLLGTYMSNTYINASKRILLNVAISKTVENWYINKKVNNIITIYNGVSSIHEVDIVDRQQFFSSFNIEYNASMKVILYPAEFNKLKNHRQLITELKKSDRRDFVVLFAGQGETEQSCRDLVQNDSRFVFLGYQMNLNRIWSFTDMLVSPSMSEGFGLILAEAAVRGIPCLVSNIPVHEEIIKSVYEDPKKCIFSLDHDGDILQKFEFMIDYEFDHSEISKKAMKLYTDKVMANNYQDIYKVMIS